MVPKFMGTIKCSLSTARGVTRTTAHGSAHSMMIIYEYSDREVDAAPAMLRVQKDKHTRVRDRVP